MTSIVQMFDTPFVSSRSIQVPDFNAALNGETMSIERLATEPLGTMTLTLTNIVVGSRYRIERQGDGSLATPTANAEGSAAGTTVAVTLDYYGSGSASNDLRIKVRKGSASTYYKDFETLATLSAAAQSAYIAQIPDE